MTDSRVRGSKVYRPVAGEAVRPSDLVVLDRRSPDGDRARGSREQRGPRSGWIEVPKMIAVTLLLTFLMRTFLLQTYYIPTESMVPTLDPQDRVLVEKVSYRFRAPARGEVIVFHRPDGPESTRPSALRRVLASIGLARPDGQVDFVKRIIGLPGDEVEVVDGVVLVNGRRLSEPYAEPETRDSPLVTVPPGRYFMMGDNRTNSLDSRYGLGLVPRERIVGRAFMILWPPRSVTFSL